jgi:hypothetical protein
LLSQEEEQKKPSVSRLKAFFIADPLGEKFILSETKWSRRKPRGGAKKTKPTLSFFIFTPSKILLHQFTLRMICRSVIFDTTHPMMPSKQIDVSMQQD